MRSTVSYVLVVALLATCVVPLSKLQAVEPVDAGSANRVAPQVTLKNVTLTPQQRLHGQVVRSTGIPITALPVEVFIGDQKYQTVTDRQGRFVLDALPQGVCLMDVAGESFACRLWQHHVAPPGSISSIAIVTGDDVVRGQDCPEKKKHLRRLTPTQRYGLAVAALFGTAAYFALDRDAS